MADKGGLEKGGVRVSVGATDREKVTKNGRQKKLGGTEKMLRLETF